MVDDTLVGPVRNEQSKLDRFHPSRRAYGNDVLPRGLVGTPGDLVSAGGGSLRVLHFLGV